MYVYVYIKKLIGEWVNQLVAFNWASQEHSFYQVWKSLQNKDQKNLCKHSIFWLLYFPGIKELIFVSKPGSAQ